jgi:hypothetical protein
MSEIYPLTSHDHITKKVINFRNVVIIYVPKGVSNFGHTIIEHVHKCKWSYKCKGKFQMFYNNIYKGNICHTKVCETSDFSHRHLCQDQLWNGYGEQFMQMYNMNGFKTETTYDYYIAMKSMFLVVKLSFHPSIWLCNSHHSPIMNYIQTTPKLFKTKSLSKSKLQFSQTLYSYHNFVQNEGASQGHKHLLKY